MYKKNNNILIAFLLEFIYYLVGYVQHGSSNEQYNEENTVNTTGKRSENLRLS